MIFLDSQVLWKLDLFIKDMPYRFQNKKTKNSSAQSLLDNLALGCSETRGSLAPSITALVIIVTV